MIWLHGLLKYSPTWKRWIYLIPLSFWTFVFASKAFEFPSMISTQTGLSYVFTFWPLMVSLTAILFWPSRASWWFVTIAWLFISLSYNWTWHLRAIVYEGVKWEAGARWQVLFYSILHTLIPLFVHWLLRPRSPAPNPSFKSETGTGSSNVSY